MEKFEFGEQLILSFYLFESVKKIICGPMEKIERFWVFIYLFYLNK